MTSSHQIYPLPSIAVFTHIQDGKYRMSGYWWLVLLDILHSISSSMMQSTGLILMIYKTFDLYHTVLRNEEHLKSSVSCKDGKRTITYNPHKGFQELRLRDPFKGSKILFIGNQTEVAPMTFKNKSSCWEPVRVNVLQSKLYIFVLRFGISKRKAYFQTHQWTNWTSLRCL